MSPASQTFTLFTLPALWVLSLHSWKTTSLLSVKNWKSMWHFRSRGSFYSLPLELLWHSQGTTQSGIQISMSVTKARGISSPHLRNVFLPFLSPLTCSVQNKEILSCRNPGIWFKISLQTNQSQQLMCDLVTVASQRETHPSPFSDNKMPSWDLHSCFFYQFRLVIGVTKNLWRACLDMPDFL